MMNTPYKQAGTALIVFTLLLLLTMGLHPAGGSVEHLIRITRVIVITHAIAILSTPVGWVGFWGITKRIGTDHILSILAFAMASAGMVAILMAATINGLALPVFLQHYKGANPEATAALRITLQYGSALNHAFDYIYTGMFCLAILCWSTAILLTKKLAMWLGWLGVAISIAAATFFISGVAVNSLSGLRLFVTAITAWILLAAMALYKQIPAPQPDNTQ